MYLYEREIGGYDIETYVRGGFQLIQSSLVSGGRSRNMVLGKHKPPNVSIEVVMNTVQEAEDMLLLCFSARIVIRWFFHKSCAI